jgi:serine/threonine protein kinase
VRSPFAPEFAVNQRPDRTTGKDDETLPPAPVDEVPWGLLPTLPAAEIPRSEEVPAGGETRFDYFGDYQLLQEIARGGMGVVYKARQVSLNRIVAIKMILSGRLAGEADVKRFHAEAEAAAQLDHSGIVPIYEIGEHGGQHYFSMAFVDGCSLNDVVRDGPLSPREAAAVMIPVCEAIQYAHDRGVVHRDLKPANVLLAHSGAQAKTRSQSGIRGDHSQRTLADFTPKVTDFGLAKRIGGDSNLTGTGQILGTPSYMPPEQAAGNLDLIGPASDVYSLGAILYCLLSGRPPFHTANPMDTLAQVLESDPVPLRQLNPTIPRDVETITLKCLEKAPSRRYRSARELADDLQRFLDDEPILARPLGPIGKIHRWTRRRPIAAGCAFSTAGLLALAAGIGSLAACVMLFGVTIKQFTEDRAAPAVTFPLTVGQPLESELVPLPTPGLHELEVQMQVESKSWDTDEQGAISPHYNYRVVYAVADQQGRSLAEGNSRLVWNASYRRYGSPTLDEERGVAAVGAMAGVGRFEIAAPTRVRVRCEIQRDQIYDSTAVSSELRIYENIRDTGRMSIAGGVLCALTPVLLLLGLILFVSGPFLITTRAKRRP